MRFRAIKAYFKKELIDIYRSKLIVMVYLMPLLIVILFGYGIKMQVTGVRTLIIDNDNSKLSKRLLSKFEHSKYFTTREFYGSEKEALKFIKKAQIDLLIIIPNSFEKNIYKRVGSELGAYIDASFPSRATTIQNYLQGVVINLASEYGLKDTHVITLNNRNMFNQALRDEEMIVPGLLGLVLLVAPAILTALIIAREKEKGTIFNFYSSSVSKAEFLFAKLLSVFLLHSINIFILFLVALYLFEMPFRGSFLLYWFSSEVYILVSLGFGLLVSSVASSQIVAAILTLMLTIIPGFLYSGMLMPVSSMSGEAYIIAHIYPVIYFNHIIYDTFLIGEGFASQKIIFYLALLMGYALFFFMLGILFLKKEIKR